MLRVGTGHNGESKSSLHPRNEEGGGWRKQFQHVQRGGGGGVWWRFKLSQGGVCVGGGGGGSRPMISPFCSSLPLVINDPSLAVYKLVAGIRGALISITGLVPTAPSL